MCKYFDGGLCFCEYRMSSVCTDLSNCEYLTDEDEEMEETI